MCLIVDANRMGRFLSEPKHSDAAPIHKWLGSGAGRIVYSTAGRFASELTRATKASLARFLRDGRARIVQEGDLLHHERRLREEATFESDDPHVLALARASGARLLYTGDEALQADFKNKDIINAPRGKVYSGARNRRLLNAHACPK